MLLTYSTTQVAGLTFLELALRGNEKNSNVGMRWVLWGFCCVLFRLKRAAVLHFNKFGILKFKVTKQVY